MKNRPLAFLNAYFFIGCSVKSQEISVCSKRYFGKSTGPQLLEPTPLIAASIHNTVCPQGVNS